MSKETLTEKGCREILDDLILAGFTKQVDTDNLVRAIMRRRGVDPRTHKLWIKAMCTLEYIRHIGRVTALSKASLYEVNLSKCTDVLKEKLRTEQNPNQRRLMP